MTDHSSAREENTNIRVARDGSWFTGEKRIVNQKVIDHFKQSLFRDAKGIYIYQTFRQFAEKGYITVVGPVLTVFRIDQHKIIFDSMDEIATNEAEVVLNSQDGAPYVFYPRLGCYAAIGSGVSPYFSELLEESADGFVFMGRPVAVQDITIWA